MALKIFSPKTLCAKIVYRVVPWIPSCLDIIIIFSYYCIACTLAFKFYKSFKSTDMDNLKYEHLVYNRQKLEYNTNVFILRNI